MSQPIYLALSLDSYKNIVSTFPELEMHTLAILDDLSVGPLYYDYSRRTDKHTPFPIPKDAISSTQRAWEALAQATGNIIIWYGNCPVEACALLATAYHLKGLGATLSLRMPTDNPEYFASLCEHPTEDILAMHFRDRILDCAEREQLAEKWKQLIRENAALRVNNNGMVVSAFETYFDHILKRNDDICSALYEIRLQCGYYFNWEFLKWRKAILSK